MSLLTTQAAFTVCTAKLIFYAVSQGYQVTWGDAYRDPRCHYGHPQSTHRQRLAVDLNLFKDGRYLTDSIDHAPLGTWWKQQHPLARWGGDFMHVVNGVVVPNPDGNHYSFEWRGVK